MGWPMNRSVTTSTTSTSFSTKPNREKWRIRESIGRYGIFVILGGAILGPCTLALLAILWGGQGPGDGQNASPSWRAVVLGGWVTQIVTLSSTVLQTCANAQSLVCTSMAAAILLENNGVPLSQVAEFSTMRGANDGPWRFLFLTSTSPKRRMFTPISLLMVILFLSTIALQLSSTLLVSDLGVTAVVGYSKEKQINMTISDDIELIAPTSGYWHLQPTEYASFGEISSGDLNPTEGGFSDTGNVKRLFLPLNKENRTRIRHYSGKSYGLNSRVACVPPVLDAKFEAHDPGSIPLPVLLTMSGGIKYDETFRRAGLEQPKICEGNVCLPSSFNCSMVTPGLPGRFGINMCMPGLANVMDTRGFTYFSDGRQDPITPHSTVFLVSKNNGNFEDWSFVNKTSPLPEKFTRNGEWAQWTLPNDINLEISLCFSESLWELSTVQMSRAENAAEPTVITDPISKTVDVTQVQRLLGAQKQHGPPNAAERMLYTVDSINETTVATRALYHLDASVCSYIYGQGPAPPESLTLNGGTASFGKSSINGFIDLVALFEDALLDTHRPALAFQSMMTVMSETILYNLMPMMDLPSPAQIQESVSATAPRRWRGLIGVLAIILTNAACIIAVTAMFLCKTRYSRQGHFWHSVSQVISDETIELLQGSGEARDDHAMEAAGVVKENDPEMRVGRCPKTRRVQVLRKEEEGTSVVQQV